MPMLVVAVTAPVTAVAATVLALIPVSVVIPTALAVGGDHPRHQGRTRQDKRKRQMNRLEGHGSVTSLDAPGDPFPGSCGHPRRVTLNPD